MIVVSGSVEGVVTMALCQLPNIVTSTSSKVYFPPLFVSNREKYLQGLKYRHLHSAMSCKRLAFVCSAKKPRDNDSDEMLPSATFDADVIPEAVEFKKDYKINHLKTVLSQKETELLLLKNEIEKEKMALSTLRDKTNAEISNIQNLILAKDAELRVTEEGLLGLKEVHIEYQAHGDAVEVTGSFNGWQHRLKMERYSSPINQASSKLRESNSWAVTLWLYPGVYEIKFVVDGHWMIDSQREVISRGHTTNNILRVEG